MIHSKKSLKKTSYFIAYFLILGSSLFAQKDKEEAIKSSNLTWEFGPMVGTTFSQNDMINFSVKEMHPGGSFVLRKHLNNSFALRANILTGSISGNDKNLSNHAPRGYTFESPIHEFTLIGEYDLLGKRRSKNTSFKKMWSPFLFVGAGMAFTSPKTNFNEINNTAQSANIAIDKSNVKRQFTSMPVGFGVKYDINEKMRFYAETGLRWVFSDYLDGISQSANPKQNDTYSYMALGLTFKLGAGKDSDNDGVKDREDLCPDEPGLLAFKGCPDSDNDGVEDKKDNCPTEKGTIETKGCPDSDNDGIVDKKDDCPTVAGVSAFKGCPDTDGDGIEDKKDKCPTEKGPTERQGCPVKDSDNDGIEDANDKCPTEKGSLQNNGCPEKKDLDSDKDGIADKDDLCPDKPGISKFIGCPDTDNDGVEDLKDNCPTEVGPISNNGCPELKKEDKQVLADAVYGVQFELGSAIIEKSSFGVLDKIVDVMQRNQKYVLSIGGHTDNSGNASANQKLSEQRARACYDYLARKNVVTNRMTYQGFGASKPIDKNNTPAGRSKNRRVEFNLTSN